ncbi:aminotransferase class III-fold pyridoxal phosphate-dependent enzyme [Pseudarthrobacter oxydans]|uniref:aspartate aminotransferase family protein n=1 Tax=Pseudarthrobacter oxydans TaxID=1671 RepID=UPI003D2C04A2
MLTTDFGLKSVKKSFGTPLLPGAVGRDTFHVNGPTPCAVRGEGFLIIDENGHELIDGNGNHTSLVHGNAHPEIVEAAERAIRDGSCWGVPNQLEWSHAELLLAKFPHMDQVRYANSGTEAVMTALRVARAVTGRDKILMLAGAYHGSSDSALVAGGPKYTRGIPEATVQAVQTVPINDQGALQQAVEADPDGFAAIIIDAMPNRAGLVSVSKDYLAAARSLATKHGIVLILDEVISLRLGPGGISGHLGVAPDLITSAKYIGGGFPVGAVLGIAELMGNLDPNHDRPLPNAGTFTGNPVSMAAGAKAIELLTGSEIERINALGDLARDIVSPLIAPYGWEMRGFGSLLRPYPKEGTPAAFQQRSIWVAAYQTGLLLTQTNLCALSTAMDESVVRDISSRLANSVVVGLEASGN